MGHGSHYHRAPGSMGTMRPMRVFKGKKLPGHMGEETVTIQNLVIVAVDVENGCLLIKGNIPGPKKSFAVIRTAVKKPIKMEMTDLITYASEEKEEPVVEETNEEVAQVEETTEEVNESSQEEAAQE